MRNYYQSMQSDRQRDINARIEIEDIENHVNNNAKNETGYDSEVTYEPCSQVNRVAYGIGQFFHE